MVRLDFQIGASVFGKVFKPNRYVENGKIASRISRKRCDANSHRMHKQPRIAIFGHDTNCVSQYIAQKTGHGIIE